jgi:hypothetical protein
VIALLVFMAAVLGMFVGVGLVLLWGNRLDGEDIASRAMDAAMDINEMVIDAHSRMVATALETKRPGGSGTPT